MTVFFMACPLSRLLLLKGEQTMCLLSADEANDDESVIASCMKEVARATRETIATRMCG
jgi:hypothetical protein